MTKGMWSQITGGLLSRFDCILSLGDSNLITCLMSFLGEKILSDSKKKEKKVTFGVLRTKVVLKFSVRLKKKRKKKCKF